MRFTTKTEYGLVCLIYLAKQASAESPRLVTIRDIVKADQLSETYVAKILNRLKVKGVIKSHQGKQGGYSLVRDPETITLKEIIEVLEGTTFEVFCEPKIRNEIVCTHFSLCGVKPIWNKTKEILDSFYSSVTLKMMASADPAMFAKDIAERKIAS
jgi:Rrf2 family protein